MTARRSARLLVVLLVVIGVVGYSPATPPTLPPCLSDDGSGPTPCVWDARVQGNWQGSSFIIGGDGSVTYMEVRHG